jgi:hypothetical protein
MVAAAHNVALIDTVPSADAFLSEESARLREFHIVSQHPLVREHLLARGHECRDISSFIDDEAFARNVNLAERGALELVQSLDRDHKVRFAELLRLDPPLDWFSPLYRHVGRYELTGILNSICALVSMLETLRPRVVICYGARAFSTLDRDGTLKDFFAAVFRMRPALVTEVAYRHLAEPASGPVQRSALRKAAGASRRAWRELRNAMALLRGRPITVLLESLYDLQFLKRDYPSASTLLWSYENHPWAIGALDAQARGRAQQFKDAVMQLNLVPEPAARPSLMESSMELLAKRIEGDVRRNVALYAQAVLGAERLLAHRQVERLIWGVDPSFGFKALLTEYFLKAKVKVVGCLHGNGYGTHIGNEQNLSAHSRCTTFLSYGYTRDDVELTSTDPSWIGACIVPVGSYRIFEAAAAASPRNGKVAQVDLFYPITNNYSLFFSSRRMKPDTFVSIQRGLLDTLEKSSDRNILVKLPPRSVDAPSALESHIEGNPLLRKTTQRVFPMMQSNDVKSVLIDCSFSTCLIEVIPFDCEVFVLHDPLVPLSAPALALLQKRAYYLYSAEEFREVFAEFINGRLLPRRDPGFLERYIYSRNRDIRSSILQAIECA